VFKIIASILSGDPLTSGQWTRSRLGCPGLIVRNQRMKHITGKWDPGKAADVALGV